LFKILVADDSQDNRTLMSRYMQDEGYSFLTASNGVEALEKVRSEMPDLVLLDVNMPIKDGFAVLAEMRRMTRRLDIFRSSFLRRRD